MNPRLSQLLTQLQTIWKQLGLNQRISLVLAAGAVLAGLGGLAMWSTRVDYAHLYGGLDEAEAGKVIAALDEAKIPYRISRGGSAIEVPASQVHQVRIQLAGKGIPRSGDVVGFEIFDKSNFGISDFVQRANYMRAVQGELARTISQMDMIESARVMVVLPENRLLVDTRKRPTASVFVRVRGNAVLPAQSVTAIRFLVANAVEGLQPNGVIVADNLGNVLSEHLDEDSQAGQAATQLKTRQELEKYLARKAEDLLAPTVFPGRAVVRVSVDINFDSLTTTEEKFDPEGQVVRSSTVTDETTESAGPGGSAGVPGVVVNTGATETNGVAAATPSNSTRKKVTNNQYEINRTLSTLTQAAGSIRRISAAVFVPMRTEGTGTERKAVPRTPEELEKLRRIVQGALGIATTNSVNRADEIVLEELPFNDQPAQEVAVETQRQQRKEFWMNLGRQVTYPVLALGVLAFFWRTLRKLPAEVLPKTLIPEEYEAVGTNGSGDHNGNGHLLVGGLRKAKQEVVTVEVLNQLIREHPDNMTEAIRSWMTRGSKAK